MTLPTFGNQSIIPRIDDNKKFLNPCALTSSHSNQPKDSSDSFVNAKPSTLLKEKLIDKNRNDKFNVNLLAKTSKKNGNALKFHNFIANQDIFAANLPQTHCLREEHGTKQITVSNWRKEFPTSSNICTKTSKANKTEIEKCLDLWSDLKQEQSILESLLAKQNSNSNQNGLHLKKMNRRKPLLVRRVLRNDKSFDECQNEPLDLSVKNKSTYSEPCIVNTNVLNFTSTSLDSIYLPNPTLSFDFSKNSSKSSFLSSTHSSIGKGNSTQVTISSFSPSPCSSSLPLFSCPSSNTLSKLETFNADPFPTSLSTCSSTCSSSRYISDGFITLANTQRKMMKEKNAKRTVIRQKLEDAFRTNGFLVKTKQVSDGDATFCKFRQLRKYTRYYLKSWHQHLPEEVNKLWKGFLPPKTAKPSSSQQ